MLELVTVITVIAAVLTPVMLSVNWSKFQLFRRLKGGMWYYCKHTHFFTHAEPTYYSWYHKSPPEHPDAKGYNYEIVKVEYYPNNHVSN